MASGPASPSTQPLPPGPTLIAPGLGFLFRHPAHFIAFGFGSGLSPLAPGSVGTFAALPVYFFFLQWLRPEEVLWLLGPLFLLGVWACAITGRSLGMADFGGVVWDEMVAFWLILALIPQTVAWFAAAYGLFRLFDIWKPFPIRHFDARLKGGFGVMFDDLLAAGYALLALWTLEWAIA